MGEAVTDSGTTGVPKGVAVNHHNVTRLFDAMDVSLQLAPGPVWTPLNPADRAAKDVAKFGSMTDMKRPAQPEEISPAYVFLASPVCSSYITGIVLPIMGSVPG